MAKIASLTQRTANRKLTSDKEMRAVAVTRAAQQSCPPSCPFFGKGCYAEAGPSGIHSKRLTKAADGINAIDVAIAEAQAIVEFWPRDGRPLRLHEVGDCREVEAARIVSEAVETVQEQGGGAAWTYTHAWRDVPREAWGNVSVLASVETAQEARDAMAQGYVPAIVATSVAEGERILSEAGLRGIGCPQETGAAKDCASCGLCFRDDRLQGVGAAIIFTPHGSGKKKVIAILETKTMVD